MACKRRLANTHCCYLTHITLKSLGPDVHAGRPGVGVRAHRVESSGWGARRQPKGRLPLPCVRLLLSFLCCKSCPSCAVNRVR